MKFSGVDFIVVKGKSSQLQVLLFSDTKIELLPAGDLLGMNVPEAMKALHGKDPASGRFIILTVPHAVISTGIGGSLDKSRMAS